MRLCTKHSQRCSYISPSPQRDRKTSLIMASVIFDFQPDVKLRISLLTKFHKISVVL